MLYVIAGATASGKTAAAIHLAKRVNGEIINADSMQVYIGMDIGTAKPTLEEREGIPHHLIDMIKPDEPFCAAQYQALAKAAIADIQQRGKVPILTGGTGFYINAVVYDTDFSQGEKDDNALRNHYEQTVAEKGASYVYALLQKRDPQAAEKIHPHNIQRVIRALAFCESTGTLFSQHNARQKEKRQAFSLDTRFYVLDIPRDILYARINKRTHAMLNAGWEAEVKDLLQKGYSPSLPAMQAIGYKEILSGIPSSLLPEKIAQSTRHYAKRQITWFKNSAPHAQWVENINP
jgi:tRNA dimethylallyltransferase